MSIDVDPVRADGDLLHVDGGAGEEHRPALRDRDHRDRVRLAERGQPRALERVDRDVDLGPLAVADLLAVVEHRRLVLLALADDDDAVHRDRVEHRAHRVDGGLVGGDLVAAADPAAGAHRRGLGHAHELEREVAVGRVGWDRDLGGVLRNLAHGRNRVTFAPEPLPRSDRGSGRPRVCVARHRPSGRPARRFRARGARCRSGGTRRRRGSHRSGSPAGPRRSVASAATPGRLEEAPGIQALLVVGELGRRGPPTGASPAFPEDIRRSAWTYWT